MNTKFDLGLHRALHRDYWQGKKSRWEVLYWWVALWQPTDSHTSLTIICPIINAQCPTPHAPCPLPHAQYPMPHFSCPIFNSCFLLSLVSGDGEVTSAVGWCAGKFLPGAVVRRNVPVPAVRWWRWCWQEGGREPLARLAVGEQPMWRWRWQKHTQQKRVSTQKGIFRKIVGKAW